MNTVTGLPLLSMYLFVNFACLFVTVTNASWQGEWIELRKRSRPLTPRLSTTTNEERGCDITGRRGVRINERCESGGTEFEDLCIVTRETGCVRTVNCTKAGSRWGRVNVCAAICWATLRPLMWYPSMYRTPVNMDVEIVTYGNNGNDQGRLFHHYNNTDQYLNGTLHYLHSMRFPQVRTFTITTSVENCISL